MIAHRPEAFVMTHVTIYHNSARGETVQDILP